MFSVLRIWQEMARKTGSMMIPCLVFACLALSDCATHSPDRFPFHVPVAESWQDLPLQYITAKDGISLAYRQVGDLQADKVLIIIPGSTMYGYYYVPFMKRINRDWLSVRTIDLRGHGHSGGPRGDVPDEDSLADDLHAHIGDVERINPRARIFISGHSMGAGVCGRYLERYGYDSVSGVVYFAPFFHWRQPGMKPAGYVDVDYFRTIFGSPHSVTQVYHPASEDSRLVRQYTKVMSLATMVDSYGSFRSNHVTPALYLMGKKDELFDWEKSPLIFKDTSRMRLIIYEDAAHLDILDRAAVDTLAWLDRHW